MRVLSYNVMEEGLHIKMIEQTNFVRSYVFLLDHMIGDRPYKLPCNVPGPLFSSHSNLMS